MRALILVILLIPHLVFADAAADARAHYQKATAHFAIGEFAQAAAEYEAAFKLRADPALLFNAAQAHRLSGRLDRAHIIYKNYLNLYPTSPNIAEVRQQIGKLERALAEQESARKSQPQNVVLPPPGPVEPEPKAAPPPPPIAQKPVEKPVYKKWWFWTALVGGVLVVGGVVTAVVVTQTEKPWADFAPVGPGRALTVGF